MPHIRLEYTDNIKISNIVDLFKAVQDILIKFSDVNIKNIKSRGFYVNLTLAPPGPLLGPYCAPTGH